ncbi:hypothetical protein ACH4U5_37645, partial [Streptomyces sp. NPDC020858]|uniref:hypothetical protein n=1 Tax=Streptomyces sp. NPDC020858 TaxID=3365097 RepID=UPI0037A10CC5
MIVDVRCAPDTTPFLRQRQKARGLPVLTVATGLLTLRHPPEREVAFRGRFIPLFYPVISRLVWCVGSRQEMVFSPVRR